ncbi:hypothetical protein H7J08_12450 [Mycobacterium frederiksbergense]|uniref:hypothetical protein n=1 Tax=Mycolicibacterium frederiksbergense TaxID=117567 RepID=UPI0021F25F9B|nr:hypothetical protein [Mycolicibacterium frederiksbergense]MCV7045477.1 hypothetical protein [Mycolicibacterium frederiksbergense]
MSNRRQKFRSSIAATTCAFVIGCGAPPYASQTTSSDTTADETTVTQSSQVPATASAAAEGRDSTVINVGIAGGVVTPTNGRAQAVVGRPIVLMVDSDVADQLHVHSVPEYTFDIQAGSGQKFEFTVDVPGRVDVELHDLDRTVVTIEVRP